MSIHIILSDDQFLLSGVPVFSCWSSGFHNVYRSLVITVQRYGVKYYLYADDTQLYISLDPDNELKFSSLLNSLEH